MPSSTPQGWPYWEVIESEQFQEDVKDILGDFERWDEIKELLDTLVARNPTAFPKVPRTDYYAVTVFTNPPRTMYFTVNEEERKITFEHLR